MRNFMKIKTDGIILDVDGTLWDSTPIVAGAWMRAARECGCADRVITADRLKGLFGRTMDAIAENLFPEETAEKRAKIMERCCRYEHQALERDRRWLCYPGVTETVKELSKRVPVCIVSNCQAGYIELFLEKTGLGPFVRDMECFGNNGRGKSENIRLVADRNRMAHPVYVGDTQGDCDASDGAGVPFILAAYGFGTADRSAARLEDFGQLSRIVESV